MSKFVIDVSVEIHIDYDDIVYFSISDHQKFNRIKTIHYYMKESYFKSRVLNCKKRKVLIFRHL
jgi:hypothetical protein